MVLEVLLAAAVGGLLWLDKFQIFQTMVSRPMVAGPVVGWVSGNVSAGMATGILYELLWLRRLPVGGYVPPDVTMASIATAAVAAIGATDPAVPVTSAVCLSFLVMFPVAFIGTHVDQYLRVNLGRLAIGAEKSLTRGADRDAYLYFAAGLSLGFGAAFLALLPLILVGSLIVTNVRPWLSPDAVRSLGFAFYVVPLVGVADLMVDLGNKINAVLFLAGLVISVGALLILGSRI